MGKFFTQLRIPLITAWKLITPPYRFAWETLFLLSIFSCMMAGLATGIVRFGISLSGFVFLILGTAWYLNEKPIKVFGLNLAHWIPGGLISFLLFGYWLFISPFWLVVSLPISAALVATTAEFISPHLKLKPTDMSGYQRIVITVLSYLIVSCWMAFGFMLYGWFERYPSLAVVNEFNNVGRSSFVVRVDLSAIVPAPSSNALNLLQRAEALVKTAIHEKPWGAVVQPWANMVWQNPLILQDSLQLDQSQLPEDKLWQVETRIASQDEGYDVYLVAIWKGPSTDPAGYYVTKTCQVIQTQQPQTPRTTTNQPSAGQPSTGQPSSEGVSSPSGESRLAVTIATVTCQDVSKPISRSNLSTPQSEK